ncbi:hypothetical protein GCM10028808_57510 [Spirosoma migulaei]
MSKIWIFSFISVLMPVSIRAQSTETDVPDYARITQRIDLGFATNGTYSTLALSINRLHGIGRSHRFRVGYGLRLTAAAGRDTEYKTAPSSLVKGPGHGSVLGLFSKNLIDNLDTLDVPSTQANSLNISLNQEYAISHRVDIGFNIDLIGFTLGPNQQGRFRANSPAKSTLSGTVQEAKLTPFNILLGDQSDRGSLNSEGYMRYRFANRISLRTGVSYTVNEFTTLRKLMFNNDRFRSGNVQGLLAASYQF